MHLHLGPNQSLIDLLNTWKDNSAFRVLSTCFQMWRHKGWYTYDVHENCPIFKTRHSSCPAASKILPPPWPWTSNFKRVSPPLLSPSPSSLVCTKEKHNYNTRSARKNFLDIPLCQTFAYGTQSCKHHCIKDWNRLKKKNSTENLTCPVVKNIFKKNVLASY